MLTENIVEVKPFIVVKAIKAIKKVTVAFKSLSSIVKAVVIIVKVIAYNILIVF